MPFGGESCEDLQKELEIVIAESVTNAFRRGVL